MRHSDVKIYIPWLKPHIQQFIRPQEKRFLHNIKIYGPKKAQTTSKYHIPKYNTESVKEASAKTGEY